MKSKSFRFYRILALRIRKDLSYLLFSELELPLASAESVEALPPPPLVWISEMSQVISRV